MASFDGRRPHMALPFNGDRNSLVFYTDWQLNTDQDLKPRT